MPMVNWGGKEGHGISGKDSWRTWIGPLCLESLSSRKMKHEPLEEVMVDLDRTMLMKSGALEVWRLLD